MISRTSTEPHLVSACDARYVALAELLDAEIVTADAARPDVRNTRWPVSAAVSVHWAESRSRISPTKITSGS